jgi:hypothetical protein
VPSFDRAQDVVCSYDLRLSAFVRGCILFFNDDLHFLDGIVAGLWEGAGHGLGCAVGIDCPAAKVVFAWFRGLQNGRPMDDCVGQRPVKGLACSVELARDRWQFTFGMTAAPVLRRRQDFGVLPFTP